MVSEDRRFWRTDSLGEEPKVVARECQGKGVCGGEYKPSSESGHPRAGSEERL
jgi:hypothetical protein